jgi:putative membrane protein
MTRTLILAGLAAALMTASARAQQTSPTESSNRAPVNDSLFVSAAATGGQAEVSLAELGVQRAKDSELRKLSQKFLDEHTKMNADLTNLATQKRIAVPRGIDARAAFCAQSLAGLSGEEFDRGYAKAQCMAHEGALAAFEAEANRGQDPDMKAWAAKNVSHIREHHKAIKPIAERLCKDEEKDKDSDDRSRKDKKDR